MGMSVSRLLDEFDAHELAEWMVYYGIEPWGEERADIRSANIAMLINNAHFKVKRTVWDYMVVKPPKPKQTFAQMRNLMWAFAGSQRKG